MIISSSSIDEVKKRLKTQQRPIIVKAQDDTFNRKILEYGKFDVLISLEQGKKRDSSRQIDSGLNEVLARIAAKNRISIGIDLEEIRNLEKKQKAIVLARIRQNIRLCRKAKTKMIILGYKDKKDASSFLASLGGSSQQASQAIAF